MNQQDLDLAARVHYSFLPDYYENEFIEIAVQAKPLGKIGGDYCSIVPLPHRKLLVGMCDVTGHGIASALFATRINTFVITQALHSQTPCQFINLLNKFLCNRLAGSFILATFCSIIFDFNNLTMKFASAAHPPVIHFKKQERKLNLLKSETTLLGIQHPLLVACRTEQIPLHSGDRILIYTDGLTDIKNGSSRVFGLKAVQAFTEKNETLDSKAFNNSLMETALNFSNGKITDDFLLMAIKIKFLANL